MRKIKYIIRNKLQRYPFIFFSILKLRGTNLKYATQLDTNLVIEGPPRMGNTFMVESFKIIQTENYKIAHHFHLPVQIIMAIKYNIPAIVLLRNPLDSCISHAITINSDKKSLKFALEWYIDFYKVLVPYIDKFIISNFNDVIKMPYKIIDKVNIKFNKSFNSGKEYYNEEKVKSIIMNIYSEGTTKWFSSKPGEINEYKLSLPTSTRTNVKSELIKEITIDPELKNLLEKANTLYEVFKKHANFS